MHQDSPKNNYKAYDTNIHQRKRLTKQMMTHIIINIYTLFTIMPSRITLLVLQVFCKSSDKTLDGLRSKQVMQTLQVSFKHAPCVPAKEEIGIAIYLSPQLLVGFLPKSSKKKLLFLMLQLLQYHVYYPIPVSMKHPRTKNKRPRKTI